MMMRRNIFEFIIILTIPLSHHLTTMTTSESFLVIPQTGADYHPFHPHHHIWHFLVNIFLHLHCSCLVIITSTITIIIFIIIIITIIIIIVIVITITITITTTLVLIDLIITSGISSSTFSSTGAGFKSASNESRSSPSVAMLST